MLIRRNTPDPIRPLAAKRIEEIRAIGILVEGLGSYFVYHPPTGITLFETEGQRRDWILKRNPLASLEEIGRDFQF